MPNATQDTYLWGNYCFSSQVNRSDLFDILAVLVVDLFAIVMTIIMISTIKSRYTSVGRKEMVQFFYSYLVCVLTDFLLVSNIIPFSSSVYKVFTIDIHSLLVLRLYQFWGHTEHIRSVTTE